MPLLAEAHLRGLDRLALHSLTFLLEALGLNVMRALRLAAPHENRASSVCLAVPT